MSIDSKKVEERCKMLGCSLQEANRSLVKEQMANDIDGLMDSAMGTDLRIFAAEVQLILSQLLTLI